MTRRERLERKAERRRDWAAGRTSKAQALQSATPDSLRHDWAFITQPGHIPERARMIRRDDKAHEHRAMAVNHESKAEGIDRQLRTSIFSDDPDAMEALADKVKALEAQRATIKTINAAWRKAGKPKADDATGWAKVAELVGNAIASSTITDARCNQARDFLDRGPFPAYVLQNLGGNIKRCRDRIEQVKRQQQQSAEAEASGGVSVKITPLPDGKQWAVVTFAEKPERAVLQALKAAGFRWGGGSWHGRANGLPDHLKVSA